MAHPEEVNCTCGEVLFSVGARKSGVAVTCPDCGKEFIYLGGGRLESIENAETQSMDVVVVEGSEEIITHDIPDEEAKERQPAPNSAREKSLARLKKKKDAAAVRSQQMAKAAADDAPVMTKTKPPPEAPGGTLPMIGFMVGSTGVALLILFVFFPIQENGLRSTPWGSTIARTRVPWPELLALIVGQVGGFLGWAVYAYRLHKKEKEDAEADEEDDDGSDDERADSARGERRGGDSKRKTPPRKPVVRKPRSS